MSSNESKNVSKKNNDLFDQKAAFFAGVIFLVLSWIKVFKLTCEIPKGIIIALYVLLTILAIFTMGTSILDNVLNNKKVHIFGTFLTVMGGLYAVIELLEFLEVRDIGFIVLQYVFTGIVTISAICMLVSKYKAVEGDEEKS